MKNMIYIQFWFWIWIFLVALNFHCTNAQFISLLGLTGEKDESPPAAPAQGNTYMESVNQPASSYGSNSNYQYQNPAPAAAQQSYQYPSYSASNSASAYNPSGSNRNVQQSNYNYQAQPSYSNPSPSYNQQYQAPQPQPAPSPSKTSGNSEPISLLGLNLPWDDEAQKAHDAQAQLYRQINENRNQEYKHVIQENQRKALEKQQQQQAANNRRQQSQQKQQSNIGSMDNLFSNPAQTQRHQNSGAHHGSPTKHKNEKSGSSGESSDSGFVSLLGLNLKYDEEDKKANEAQSQLYRQINEDRQMEYNKKEAKRKEDNQKKSVKEQAEIRRLESEQQSLLKRLEALESGKDKSSHRRGMSKDEELGDSEDGLRKSKHHGLGSGTKNRHSSMFDNPSPYVDKILLRGRNDGMRIKMDISTYLALSIIILI